MKPESKQRKNLLILLGLAVASVAAFFIINTLSNARKPPSETLTVDDVTKEILDLEGTVMELEVVLDSREREITDIKSLLDEKYDRINFLEKQLEELERQGKADQSTINELRGKLAGARTELLEAYKIEINQLVVDNSGLTQTVDSLVFAIERRDSLLTSMTGERDQIRFALDNCQNTRGTAPAAGVLPQIKADNFNFKAPFQKGNFNKFRVSQKDLTKLELCFDMVANEAVKQGQKRFYLLVVDPSGKVCTNTLGQSGRFFYAGRESVYSARATLPYEPGTTPQPCLEFTQTEFQAGNYNVSVICEDGESGQTQLIGNTSFFVQR
ncbi:MAG: hypothetical protein NW241_23055 [Bacteroidia bacterium]|nr:hypothetical protein [Bacteroidia bacterium]